MAIAMFERGVPLVPLPAIARIARREQRHHPVAHDLGDDRRTGDRVDLRVAIDDRRCTARPTPRTRRSGCRPRGRVRGRRAGDRSSHGQVGRVVDVQLVDLADRRGAHADGDGAAADDRFEALALGRGQGLGVADAGDPVAARLHDHGRGDDGAASRRDPDLVDADDACQPVTPQAALVAEGRDDGGHRAQAYRSQTPPGPAGVRTAGRGGVKVPRQPLVRRSRRVAALPTRSRRK